MSPASDLGIVAFRDALDRAIRSAINDGARTVEEICARCKGAGIEIVALRLEQLGFDEQERLRLNQLVSQRGALARNRAGRVLSRLPAPDPERAQWWFTTETIERLSRLVASLANRAEVAWLGMPSVVAHYCTRYEASATLLDADPDVVAATELDCALPESLRTKGSDFTVSRMVYNVKDAPDPSLENRFSVVALDPPWYALEFHYFAARALALTHRNAFVVATIPGILTRPGLDVDRPRLLAESFKGLTIVNIYPEMAAYRVPLFEGSAHAALGEVSGRPWRHADVVVLARNGDIEPPDLPEWTEPEILTFSKNSRELRMFLAPARTDNGLVPEIEPVAEYASSVSRRDTSRDTVTLWSSNKKGFKVKDAAVTRAALEIWAGAKNPEAALNRAPDTRVKHVLVELFKALELPADTRDIRRTDASLVDLNKKVLSTWATEPSERQTPEPDDSYRLPHARDRDRVIWSDGLKRLANKTQVFSLENSDYVRQRLAHSIEVMQIAATIGTSFGLDRDLIEAGALAHDIGHTPFGHAGEHALDVTINAISPGFGGFNHYEHGVDVVRWLEDPYRSVVAGGAWGLNLTQAVSECIFKHTFCLGGHRISQAELWNRSKYKENWPQLAGATPCHLEGQAVRIADKISYLVSDLEDGIRLGAIRIHDLKSCRLFEHAPLDYDLLPGESDMERYLSQRRSLLKFLIEDVINATAKHLARVSDKSSIGRSKEYVVDHSTAVRDEVGEVWHRLQSGILHQDPRVVSSNLHASKIVSSLFLLCAIQPALIDQDFARSHSQLAKTPYMDWYRQKVGQSRGAYRVPIKDDLLQHLRLDAAIGVSRSDHALAPGERNDDWRVPVEQFVMAKDYVASLTDARARRLYQEIVAGGDR